MGKVKKLGRPRIEIDWDKFHTLLQYKPTLHDCADIMGMSPDTIERAIKREYKMTFSEYRRLKMSKMRMKLAQKQFEMAMEGSIPLLIWLGKQHLGQSDKQETKSEIKHTSPTRIEIVAKTKEPEQIEENTN